MALPRPSLAIHFRGRQLADTVVLECICMAINQGYTPNNQNNLISQFLCHSPEHPGPHSKLLLLPPPPAMRGMIFWEFEIRGKTEVVSLSISGTKNSQGKTTKTTN